MSVCSCLPLSEMLIKQTTIMICSWNISFSIFSLQLLFSETVSSTYMILLAGINTISREIYLLFVLSQNLLHKSKVRFVRVCVIYNNTNCKLMFFSDLIKIHCINTLSVSFSFCLKVDLHI